MSILLPLIALSFLIFIHEFGHFIGARCFGVKVEAFSIGFGKKIYKKVYRGTEYCISLIPFGGYVQMKGQDDTDPLKRSLDQDSYNVKATWKRIIILVAGPLANLLTAFFIYLIIANIGVYKIAPVIGGIKANSPASVAELKRGDKIIAIDSKSVVSWGDILKSVRDSKGEMNFTIQRDGDIVRKNIQPTNMTLKNIYQESIQEKGIGIYPEEKKVFITYSFVDSIPYAYEQTINASKLIYVSLEKLLTGVVPLNQLGGVVAIVKISSDTVSYGIVAFLSLIALISVNLGVLNLLPIPALDGGHILFTLYEMIFRRVPNQKIMHRLTIIGWIFLIALIVFTLFNDVIKIFSGAL